MEEGVFDLEELEFLLDSLNEVQVNAKQKAAYYEEKSHKFSMYVATLRQQAEQAKQLQEKIEGLRLKKIKQLSRWR